MFSLGGSQTRNIWLLLFYIQLQTSVALFCFLCLLLIFRLCSIFIYSKLYIAAPFINRNQHTCAVEERDEGGLILLLLFLVLFTISFSKPLSLLQINIWIGTHTTPRSSLSGHLRYLSFVFNFVLLTICPFYYTTRYLLFIIRTHTPTRIHPRAYTHAHTTHAHTTHAYNRIQPVKTPHIKATAIYCCRNFY